LRKISRLINAVGAPASCALVLVCESCGKRAANTGGDSSKRLASRIKKICKRRWEKGEVRAILTSCMNVCPDDRIAVCIAPSAAQGTVTYLTIPADDVESSAEAIADLIAPMRRTAASRKLAGGTRYS
jgi:predicted metal-binding protein